MIILPDANVIRFLVEVIESSLLWRSQLNVAELSAFRQQLYLQVINQLIDKDGSEDNHEVAGDEYVLKLDLVHIYIYIYIYITATMIWTHTNESDTYKLLLSLLAAELSNLLHCVKWHAVAGHQPTAVYRMNPRNQWTVRVVRRSWMYV
mgnify:CR=1 FL=1